MDAHGIVLTYRDYAALPDDGRRYELHAGVLSVTPAPGSRHQRISANLSDVLRAHVKARVLGEVLYAPLDVILSDTTVVQPDLVYVDRSRQALISDRGVEGAPTLVIEILSPSTSTIDRVTKPALYARHGVPWLWLLEPESRTLEVLELRAGAHARVLRASGLAPINPPPFLDLALVPDTLWP